MIQSVNVAKASGTMPAMNSLHKATWTHTISWCGEDLCFQDKETWVCLIQVMPPSSSINMGERLTSPVLFPQI